MSYGCCVQVRSLAAQHVLALTGTIEGAELLVRAEAAESLAKCIGDVDVRVAGQWRAVCLRFRC